MDQGVDQGEEGGGGADEVVATSILLFFCGGVRISLTELSCCS